jgi:hypothetical protein
MSQALKMRRTGKPPLSLFLYKADYVSTITWPSNNNRHKRSANSFLYENGEQMRRYQAAAQSKPSNGSNTDAEIERRQRNDEQHATLSPCLGAVNRNRRIRLFQGQFLHLADWLASGRTNNRSIERTNDCSYGILHRKPLSNPVMMVPVSPTGKRG